MSVVVTREPSGYIRLGRRIPGSFPAASTVAIRYDLDEFRDHVLAAKAGAYDHLVGLPAAAPGSAS